MAISKKGTKRALTCTTCKLKDGDIKTYKMEPYGSGEKKVLIIGEAPGKVEDRKGMPWQGRAGRLLQRYLHKSGIDLFQDCLCVNAVNCRPPDNRTPRKLEVDCCRNMVVDDVIKDFKPKVIILLGAVAVQSFLAPRWPVDLGGITKWRGFRIPDQDHHAWIVPTFHPAYILRAESREANTIFEQDLRLAAEAIGMRVPLFQPPKIHYIQDLSVLNELKNSTEIAIDYETTGLKARMKGQRIICTGVCASEDEVYAFMMPKTMKGLKPYFDLLTDPKIGKMGHNIKYEKSWTHHRYGIDVVNWQWDSMIAAHIIDNRSYTTGLKFQAYIYFGVLIKDEDVSKYIYTKDENNKGFNKVYELLEQEGGEHKLLTHVAMDAYFEYLLAKKQMKELDYNYLPF